MFFIRRVQGESMQPALPPKRIVVFKKTRRFRTNQVVCARHEGREIVKRLLHFENGRACLKGDNPLSASYRLPIKALRAVLIYPRRNGR